MNQYELEAIKIERRLLSKWSERSIFLTGKGSKNTICGLTSDRIAFRTSNSKVTHYINRLKLRKSIAYLLDKKTATRKELEKYSHMNSALLGLLKHLFIETAKISITVGGLLRLTIKGVRYFFSGLERASLKDREAIKVNGAKSILASYYYLRESSNPKLFQFIEENNMELLLDSGEFSAYKARMKNGWERRSNRYYNVCQLH